MTDTPFRDIRTWTLPRSLPEIVQALLAADLLDPPRHLWIVSPWVTDVPVLDNSAGGFAILAPDWDHAPIRLSLVLARLLACGTTVRLAVRGDGLSDAFVAALRRQTSVSAADSLGVYYADTLHEKGLLSDHYYLRGSFNLTHSGLNSNEEAATLHTAPAEIAEAQMAFVQRWEGQQ